MKKALVIGGTGLISTAVVNKLLDNDWEVWCLNRGNRSFPPRDRCHTLLADRTHPDQISSALQNLPPFDVVIDMVCFDPQSAEAAVNLFRGKTSQYIFCSTVDVYQRPALVYPYKESHPRQGRSTYAQQKILAEDVFCRAQEEHDFPLTIVRPGFTTGEGGIIVHTFGRSTSYLDRIRKGKPVVVHGDGNGFWTAAHRNDVGAAIAAAAGNPITFGKTYHIAGEEWLTWNRYLEIVSEILGAPGFTPIHIPVDLLSKAAPRHASRTIEHYQYHGIFDNSEAIKDLGFRYTIPWKETARLTINSIISENRLEDSDKNDFDDILISAWNRFGDNLVDVLHKYDQA